MVGGVLFVLPYIPCPLATKNGRTFFGVIRCVQRGVSISLLLSPRGGRVGSIRDLETL